jgi:hypothetical protein
METNSTTLAITVLSLISNIIMLLAVLLKAKKEIKITVDIKNIPKVIPIITNKFFLFLNRMFSSVFPFVVIIILSYQLTLLYRNDVIVTQQQIVNIGFKFFLLAVNVIFIVISQMRALFWRWIDNMQDGFDGLLELININAEACKLSKNK